jgi:predicted transglutaminase-like cysteine proteinase
VGQTISAFVAIIRRFGNTFLLLTALLLTSLSPSSAFAAGLFGSIESHQTNLEMFPQWLSVLERHVREDVPKGDCDSKQFNRCHLEEWLAFLQSLKGLDTTTQLKKINLYANNKTYILDIDNYGLEDYWAIPKQFLNRGGDCEDYAITKLLSLRWLGQQQLQSRIVVLQDTNLGIPHAILAVYLDGDTFILDNQVNEILSHKNILHYVPIYSLDEKQWWIHLPS